LADLTVTCRINGQAATLRGHSMARLLDVLRRDAHLTGTKEGCGEGECGACSVLLDGRLVNSCLVPLVHANGAEIVTIEGVASADRLHAVQEAFVQALAIWPQRGVPDNPGAWIATRWLSSWMPT